MDPNDLWGTQPIATVGDDELYTTFGAVGAALTSWELFEAHLSLIFAAVVGGGIQPSAATRAYGSVVSFSGRLSMLRAAADMYFAENPESAALAVELQEITKEAHRAGTRRNEIAHGVVQATGPGMTFLRGKFLLYPAYYTTSKRERDHKPKYGYASNDLVRFMQGFDLLRERTKALLVKIQTKP
ncbi:MAG: hypothetical protein U1C74_13525 [Phenylobacterium sp.]|nr:hypothetical protein [Phenylobacterium sp.]